MFWSSVFLAVAGLWTGCRNRTAATADSGKLFVYCTRECKPFASALGKAAGATCGRKVTLFPLKPQDLLSAVLNTHAGDFAVTLDDRVIAGLKKAGLAASARPLGQLGLCVVSRSPLTRQELFAPGKRIGVGKKKGPLGKALLKVVGPADAKRLAPNVCHRSEDAADLVRLVQLGTLDAAVVWQKAKVPAGLHQLPLGNGKAGGTLQLVRLGCSRLSATAAAAAVKAFASAATDSTLAALGVEPASGGTR